MKISYDPEVDALSITFRETTVTTKHLAEGIAADYDSEGRLAGLEILDAQKRFGGAKPCAGSNWKALAHDCHLISVVCPLPPGADHWSLFIWPLRAANLRSLHN